MAVAVNPLRQVAAWVAFVYFLAVAGFCFWDASGSGEATAVLFSLILIP